MTSKPGALPYSVRVPEHRFSGKFPDSEPNGTQWQLLWYWAIYAAWAVVLAVMYLPCRWFAGVKARHPGGWLSYL